MSETAVRLQKGDWVRFQLRSDRRVLEGFVQEISASRLRVGKGPDSPEAAWYELEQITILKKQER